MTAAACNESSSLNSTKLVRRLTCLCYFILQDKVAQSERPSSTCRRSQFRTVAQTAVPRYATRKASMPDDDTDTEIALDSPTSS